MDDLISRQAAIDALEDAEDAFGYLTKDWREVLEQLPPIHPVNNSEMPNSSDVISRQAAIDALRKLREEDIEDYGCEIPEGFNQDHLDRATFAIKQLPTIQPQPQRGRWILDRSGAYCCSECMEPCAGYVMMKPRDKFCKMCGAKMEVTT